MQFKCPYFQLFLAAVTYSSQAEAKPVRLAVHKKNQNQTGREPLTGHSDDFWSGKLLLGTPPQSFDIDFDTGSANTWINSAKCKSGCGTCARYNSSQSSTYVKDGDRFSIQYGDGSGDFGFFSQDSATIAGLTAKNHVFAEVTQQKGPASTQGFCGIVGMGFKQLAVHDVTPFVQLLAQENPDVEPVFAFYLPESKTDETGELVIGGVDPADFDGKLHSVPAQEVFEGYWQAYASVDVAGKTAMSKEVTIIDSGTTVMLTDGSVISDITAAVGGDSAVTDCSTVISKGPKMTVKLGDDGASYDFTAADYAMSGGEGYPCLGVYDAGGMPLFGDVFMRVVYTVFNLEKKTMSFAYANNKKSE